MLDSVYERIVEVVNSSLVAGENKKKMERDNKLTKTKKKKKEIV